VPIRPCSSMEKSVKARPVAGSRSRSERPSAKPAGTLAFSSETGRRGVSLTILRTLPEGDGIGCDFTQQLRVSLGSMFNKRLAGVLCRQLGLTSCTFGMKVAHHPAHGNGAGKTQNGVFLGHGARRRNKVLRQFHRDEILAEIKHSRCFHEARVD